MGSRSDETVRNELNTARRTTGLTWQEMGKILGVPQGTLWDIANGKPVPRKWRAKLGIRKFKDLYAMPTKELRWSLENRTDM